MHILTHSTFQAQLAQLCTYEPWAKISLKSGKHCSSSENKDGVLQVLSRSHNQVPKYEDRSLTNVDEADEVDPL